MLLHFLSHGQCWMIIFFPSHICFSSNSLLSFCITFIFLLWLSCALLFLFINIVILHIYIFITLMFKNILSLFSPFNFVSLSFLDFHILLMPFWTINIIIVLVLFHSVTKPWAVGLLNDYVSWPEVQKTQHSSLEFQVTHAITKLRGTEVTLVQPIILQSHHSFQGDNMVSDNINKGLIQIKESFTSI